jgi:hypothetical protein
MNDDFLIQQYLDGSLSREDHQRLNQRLRDDPALREEIRFMAEQAVAFGDMARLLHDVNPPVVIKKQSARFTWLALAASVAVLATSVWFFLHSTPSLVLTLIESSGTVAWTHGEPIQPGDSLPAGTLETLGEASTATLQFHDGSLITLHGEAEISFSDERQKVISLTRGTLSAEVKPQPVGRPMLIHTPCAVAEVVGTAFDLSARSEDTLLKVNEGLVKLKRLADGSQIDVPANRSVVASLAAETSLDAASTPEPLTTWSFDFTTTTPPRDWRGISKHGLMQASLYVAKKLPDGRIITHHGVSIRTAMLEQPLRLIANENSVILYRLQMKEPSRLQLMLLTNRPDGRFGGNFECHIEPHELTASSVGWYDIAIPLARYKPVDPRPHIRERQPTTAGAIITSAIISTFSSDQALAVSHFALKAHP